MKYETPEMTALTPAINAILALSGKEGSGSDSPNEVKEIVNAYQDWE